MTFRELNYNTTRITHLVGWGNYTRVFLTDSSPEVNATTLKKCVGTLPGFIRLSKSLAVNPYHIVQIRRKGDRCADVLIADKWLPVSRRRVTFLIKYLHELPGANVKGLFQFRVAVAAQATATHRTMSFTNPVSQW